jgi:hypothetical protein
MASHGKSGLIIVTNHADFTELFPEFLKFSKVV